MKTKIKFLVQILIITCLVSVVGTAGFVKSVRVENNNVNKTINLNTMALKHEEVAYNELYTAKDSYIGDLTGYAYNCPLCTGRLACMSRMDLSDGTLTYNDATYGEVRIVASSRNLPCGTIIRFDSKRVSDEPVIAIVLDRGVLGSAIDLLTPSEGYAAKYIGRSTIYYEVLRNGWKKN